MRFSSWYGIGVGTLIILQWIFFLATNSVPEFQTTPWAIGFRMTAIYKLKNSYQIPTGKMFAS